MRAAWLLVALAACAHEGLEGQEPQPVPVTVPAPVAVDAMPAPVDAAPTADDSFRAAVREFAAHSKDGKRQIAAWGTLHVDGSDKPYRFATLDTLRTKTWEMEDGSARTGMYIVEKAPDEYWVIGYWWTASGWQAPEMWTTDEPAWVVLADTAIAHGEMHNHGKSHTTFGLRGGKWVVLHEDDYNDRAEPDNEQHTYVAKDGTCKSCPPLAKHTFRGASLVLWWPAHSIAELTAPTLDMMNINDLRGAPGPEVDHVVPIPPMPAPY